MKWRRLLGLVLGTAAWPTLAHAELGDDVSAVVTANQAYGKVVRLKPRLLERGDALPLPVPVELLDAKDPSCTSVALLTVPGVHFAARFTTLDPSAPSSAFPESSSAGALELSRCGADKPYLASVLVDMRSPRALLEVVVSNSPSGGPKLHSVLPNRDPGVELALGDPGPRAAPPPLAERLRRLTERANRQSASNVRRDPWPAADDGTGSVPLVLDAGCHELTLLAEPAGPGAVPDVDAELVAHDDNQRLAVDRAEDADASLSVCFGGPTVVELRFMGAPPRGALQIVHARWDLPSAVPSAWGGDVRARLASVVRTQRVRLDRSPLYGSLGVQGSTELPLEVEPGACYTAVLAPLRGEVRALSLAVRVHASGEATRSALDSGGTAVSFCARGARRATLQVDSQGANLAWIVGVWPAGRAPLGAREP